MESTKVKAWECLQKNNINELNIDVANILKNMGYTVRTYSVASEYLEHLTLKDVVLNYSAITIVNDKVVLYSDSLSFAERNITLAHELGHIYLEHTSLNSILGKSSSTTKQNEQEAEADIFALEFLAPTPVLATLNIVSHKEISRLTGLSEHISKSIVPTILEEKELSFSLSSVQIIDFFNEYISYSKKYKTKNKFNFFGILILLIVLISIISLSSNIYINSNKAAEINTNSNTEIEKIYYVTKTGSKYHIDGCMYLSDSKIPISLPDAIENNYIACSVCIGED